VEELFVFRQTGTRLDPNFCFSGMGTWALHIPCQPNVKSDRFSTFICMPQHEGGFDIREGIKPKKKYILLENYQ